MYKLTIELGSLSSKALVKDPAMNLNTLYQILNTLIIMSIRLIDVIISTNQIFHFYSPNVSTVSSTVITYLT